MHLDVFAVSAGPGSFTGLRVGLTAAKGWAEVYRKPVVGVSSLDAVAFQALSSGSTVLVPALDARRGQIYFGVYRTGSGGPRARRRGIRGHARRVCREAWYAGVQWRRDGGNGAAFTIVTPDASVVEVVSRLISRNFPPASLRLEIVSGVLAPSIGRIAHARALRGDVSDALTLDANYVRRTDAEMSWKDG